MTKVFNLLEEAWIPCLQPDSPNPVDYPLLDLIRNAHELRAIQHSSPIVTLVLYRFVMAFLYSAWRGPQNLSGVQAILEKGRFDVAPFEKYAADLDSNERFWLFHPDRPFLQDPGMAAASKPPLSIFQLFRETAAPEGATLFDHTLPAPDAAITAAEAARYLLADQLFGLQDGSGYAPTMLSFGAATLVAGANLFDTLVLNLLPYNADSPMKSDLQHDAPSWEREWSPPTSFPAGWLDYLTRPCRGLLLVTPDGDSVTKVYRKSAPHLDNDWRAATSDPWLAYRVTDKGSRAVSLRADRALWRDSGALVGLVRSRDQRLPGYTSLLARLGRQANIEVFGVVANNNRVDLWRQERLPLPAAYLEDPELAGELERAIAVSEQIRDVLYRQFCLLARHALIPNWDQLSDADQKKQWAQLTKKRPGRKPSRLDHFFETLNWERPYWAALDAPFRTLMVDLADAWPHPDAPLRAWAEALRDAAEDAFEAAARSVETTGRGLRAAAEARAQFGAELHRILAPFMLQAKQEKEAQP